MQVTIEITDVIRAEPYDTFVSKVIDDISEENLDDWRFVFITLVTKLTDLGISKEQMLYTIDNIGESFLIEEGKQR